MTRRSKLEQYGTLRSPTVVCTFAKVASLQSMPALVLSPKFQSYDVGQRQKGAFGTRVIAAPVTPPKYEPNWTKHANRYNMYVVSYLVDTFNKM